jgi:hypothetical protein
MSVVMRLVKKTALSPETSAFPGQLEAAVQWLDVIHTLSIMWREFLKGIELNCVRALINFCIILFFRNILSFNVYM